MRVRTAVSPLYLTAALCWAPCVALAQGTAHERVHVAVGGGLLTSGAYFTGPGNLALDNSDAFAGTVQVIVPVHRSISLVAGGVYARPTWRLSGIPLLGSVGVDGASLWFADAGVRGELPLGEGAARPTAFAQVGAGLAHFGVSTAVLGRALDESATNFALSLGTGLALPVARRVGLELAAKDYIVSFKSVHEFDALGIEGRRAHTLVVSVAARLEL